MCAWICVKIVGLSNIFLHPDIAFERLSANGSKVRWKWATFYIHWCFYNFQGWRLIFTDLFCIFNILWTYYFTFYISFNWSSFPVMMLAGRKLNFHYGISHMLSINLFFHFMCMNCYIWYGDIFLKEDYILDIHFHET